MLTAFYKEGDYKDSVGNAYHYLFRIPVFSCESADAIAMNNRMYDHVMGIIRDDLEHLEDGQGFSMLCITADYEYYQNGDYLSVVEAIHNDWGMTDYFVINLDTWTQREASRGTLLAYAGLNEVSFLERAQKAAGDFFGDFSQYPEDMQQFAEDQYAKTVMPENFGDDLQLFIDGEGRLCMIARIYSMAGADYYYHIVPLQ